MTILILAFLSRPLFLMNTSPTCAKVKGITIIKVNKYMVYEFYIGKKKKQAKRSLKLFKIQDIDSLKKMDCIKIRYSNIWNSVTEVIDKRLVD